ncbi:MAG: DoxX family protein [Myxococcales bacterium]|nr:DoxX family protein [Myxococcales bacterium]
MNITLWIAQILLALAFGMAGFIKTATPIAELGQQMPWVLEAPSGLVRFIGLSELAGAIGVVLPAATRIKPWLTPLAAAGLVVVMVLALGFHAIQGDPLQQYTPSLVLGLIAAFVARGRWSVAPIRARA